MEISPLTLSQRLFATFVGLALAIFVLRLVRRQRLDIALSVWWALASAGIIVFAWFDRPIIALAARISLKMSSVLLVSGNLFILFTCLHISSVITRLSQQNRRIAQNITVNSANRLEQHLAHTQSSLASKAVLGDRCIYEASCCKKQVQSKEFYGHEDIERKNK